MKRDISAKQKPLGSGYNFYSTSDDVMKGVVLEGYTVIVTGGYSGIGLETVKRLREAGATVIVPGRNVTAVRELFHEIKTGIEVEYMDLMNPESISNFVEKFLASGRPLNLLINNAGVMACPLNRDARGYESQFSTNHLGHYQLTVGLWSALKKANGARVINVSSLGHRFSDINYSDPNFESSAYDRWKAYGQSKTANILFSVQLDKLGKADGIRAFSLHPGRIIDTNLKKYLSTEELIASGVLNKDGTQKKDDSGPAMKSIEQGAATTLFCATSALLNGIGGVHCEDSDIAEVLQEEADVSKMSKGVLPYAVDGYNAERLWDLSYKLTGVTIA